MNINIHIYQQSTINNQQNLSTIMSSGYTSAFLHPRWRPLRFEQDGNCKPDVLLHRPLIGTQSRHSI